MLDNTGKVNIILAVDSARGVYCWQVLCKQFDVRAGENKGVSDSIKTLAAEECWEHDEAVTHVCDNQDSIYVLSDDGIRYTPYQSEHGDIWLIHAEDYAAMTPEETEEFWSVNF